MVCTIWINAVLWPASLFVNLVEEELNFFHKCVVFCDWGLVNVRCPATGA